jgi:hypothetical protein
MSVLAIGAMAVLLAWSIGVVVLALKFPRFKKRIVGTAVAGPAVVLGALLMIHGNFSATGWVASPPGLSHAEVRSRLDEVFSQKNLERLIGEKDLSSALTAREAKAHLELGDPGNDRDAFRWSLDSGRTWKWKANAYRQLSMALADAIERSLGDRPRPR